MAEQASVEVLAHAGGAWDASLNHYGVGGNCMVTTQQIDERVYVVGQDDYSIGCYTLSQWLDGGDEPDQPFIECDDAADAWDLLRTLREDCFLWHCGACDAWIFTSNRPRIGVLRCSTCGRDGVDFRHADQHLDGAE